MGVGRALVAVWIAAGLAGVLSMASRTEIVMKMIGSTYPHPLDWKIGRSELSRLLECVDQAISSG